MRRVSLLAVFAFAVLASAQIAVGPDTSAGVGIGIVKYFNWLNGTGSGCTPVTNVSYCSPNNLADTLYWSAWLPNAAGLPITSGLPIVGTPNGTVICSGAAMVVAQLDQWSWATPNATRVTKVNCMVGYNTSGPSVEDSPAGWFGMNTSNTSGVSQSHWKNRTPFSKGGILYLPVERQTETGAPTGTHDATYIMSPDSGQHWCNPYTYFHRSGSPGCDSSNWSATGDAPICGAVAANNPCTNSAYLDGTHSSMMWQLPVPMENWTWINYGYQDGAAAPATTDGCDPSTYTCFIALDGAIARVVNSSILDISAWQYYTCPTATSSYRCSGLAAGSWTSTFSARTPVLYTGYYGGTFASTNVSPYGMTYVKEFQAYLMTGNFPIYSAPYSRTALLSAPAPYGPWTYSWQSAAGGAYGIPALAFFSPSPGLGYTVISTNPPHVQMAINSNNYSTLNGTPEFALFDLVGGQNLGGSAAQMKFVGQHQWGLGFTFDAGNVAGSFPRNGLVLAFDFSDAGLANDQGLGVTATNWPFFTDRAGVAGPSNSAVIAACDNNYAVAGVCGATNSGHGTDINRYGIATTLKSPTAGHFRTQVSEMNLTDKNAPAAMQGNGTYSVIGVYRANCLTSTCMQFGHPTGLWATGVASGANNTMVALTSYNGQLALDWNTEYQPHYQVLASEGFGNTTDWIFVAVTVDGTGANIGVCPTVKIWQGTAGALLETSSTCAAKSGAFSKLPNVSAYPLILGSNGDNNEWSGTTAATLVYNRALSSIEVQAMYQTMKAKMLLKGIMLQ